MAFPTHSKIENNILYPLKKTPLPNLSRFQEKPFVEYLFEVVRKNLSENGDRPWLTNGAVQVVGRSQVLGEETVMLSEVEQRSRMIARVLHHKYHLVRGDVVHIVLPNTTQYYYPVLATWILQGVVSPADPGLAPQVLATQLQDAGTKVIFCCQNTLEKVRTALAELKREVPIIVIDNDHNISDNSVDSLYSLLEEELPDITESYKIEENERCLLCWSSGTTGRPKGIQHGSNLFIKLLTDQHYEIKSLQTTCMFHMGGFYNPIRSLCMGSVVFLAGEDLDLNPSLILKSGEMVAPDSLVCGTHHAVLLASMDSAKYKQITSLKMVWPLGANIYDGIAEDLKKFFPNLLFVGNVYGQSEVFSPVGVSTSQTNLGGLHSVMEALKFVDEETGESVGPGIVGEFAVKPSSYTVMLGYLNNKEENEHFFGKDGFLYLGDLGHYDENGVIFYDGRKKDLIKYKNSHLYPKELEDLIMKHQDVEDVAVFGKPEPTVQELVTAVVVRKKQSVLDAAEIIKQVNNKVDDHKKLRGGVYFVDKIPRNPQGKILRGNLLRLI